MALVLRCCTLPDELRDDILARLPIKSLLSLRCVCKSWRGLIDDRSFQLLHLKKGRTGCKTKILFISNDPSSFRCDLKDAHSFETSEMVGYLKSRRVDPEHLTFFTGAELKDIIYWRLVCSFQGMYLLQENRDDPAAQLMLWNPALRKTKLLPAEYISPLKERRFVFNFGVGVAEGSLDYKVIRLLFIRGSGLQSVFVYSFQVGTWSSVQFSGDNCASCLFDWRDIGVCFKGVLYRIAIRERQFGHSLVSYDLATNFISIIELPEMTSHSQSNMYSIVLVDDDELLGVVDISEFEGKLWVRMTSEGHSEAGYWSIRYSFPTLDLPILHRFAFICVIEDGVLLLRVGKTIQVYKTKDSTSTVIFMSRRKLRGEAFPFVSSLVWPA